MKKLLVVTSIMVLLVASSLPVQAGEWDWVKSANLVDLTHSGYGMLILPMNYNDEFIFYIAAADYDGQDTTATCGVSYYEDPLNYFVKGTLNTSVSKEDHYISWRSDGHHLTILTCVYASGYIGNIHMVAGDNAVLKFPTDSIPYLPISSDYVGIWQGSFVLENEQHFITLTLDNNLLGTLRDSYDDPGDINHIAGHVSNGTLSFAVPLSDSDVGDPDCANWDLNCSGTLYQDLRTLSLTCSGIVCADGGGEYINLSFTLNKQ